MVERALSMREAQGSIPCSSSFWVGTYNHFFLFFEVCNTAEDTGAVCKQGSSANQADAVMSGPLLISLVALEYEVDTFCYDRSGLRRVPKLDARCMQSFSNR